MHAASTSTHECTRTHTCIHSRHTALKRHAYTIHQCLHARVLNHKRTKTFTRTHAHTPMHSHTHNPNIHITRTGKPDRGLTSGPLSTAWLMRASASEAATSTGLACSPASTSTTHACARLRTCTCARMTGKCTPISAIKTWVCVPRLVQAYDPWEPRTPRRRAWMRMRTLCTKARQCPILARWRAVSAEGRLGQACLCLRVLSLIPDKAKQPCVRWI